MFADLHHFTILAPAVPVSTATGGSVTGGHSFPGGTTVTNANIYFGALHINNANVAETWLDDDQVSDMNTGGNGPVTRNEGMYNNYTAVKTFWSDTTRMDNLRGADATGVATPGAQETFSTNTTHTTSDSTF
jgi:hypothetical protein